MRTNRFLALAIATAAFVVVAVPAPAAGSTSSCDEAANALKAAFADAGFVVTPSVAALIPPVVDECPPLPAHETVAAASASIDRLAVGITAHLGLSCVASTGTAPYPTANVHVTTTIGGVTDTRNDRGAATVTYNPQGTAWKNEYWTEGFGSLYGFLSHDMDAPSFILVAGTPMQADVGDAFSDCLSSGGAVCTGNGWATITRADLSIRVWGDFNRCSI